MRESKGSLKTSSALLGDTKKPKDLAQDDHGDGSKSATLQSQRSSVESSSLKKNSILPERYQFRIGMYVRLSPSDEIREEGSLVSHPQRMQDFVKYRNTQNPNWGIITEEYVDKDLSGKDLNRPAFKQMLKDVKSGKINAVIATELSRLSRNVKDFCQLWEFLKHYKATFFTLKETFDTSTPMGELMVIQSISFSQFERKTIVERIKNGSRARADRGLSNGGQRCLGYDPNPERRNYLVLNNQEVPLVKTIFENFLELGTIATLREWLNEKGIRTKNYISKRGKPVGGKLFCEGSLYHTLTNKVYIGQREINKSNRFKSQETLLPEDRYRSIPAVWPAIISEDLFNEVQAKLGLNRANARKALHVYMISGLTICGECGEPLVGVSATSANGQVYHYYGHKRKFVQSSNRHLKRCALERVRADLLEAAILKRLLTLSKDKALVLELTKQSQSKAKDMAPELEDLMQSRRAEVRKNIEMIRNLTDRIATLPAHVPAESLFEKLKELEDQKILIQRDLNTLAEQKRNLANNVIDMESTFRMFKTFNAVFKDQSVGEQKALIMDLIYSVRVTRTKLFVEYYASKETDEIEFDSLLNEDLNTEAVQNEKSHGGLNPVAAFGSGSRGSQVPLTTRLPVRTDFNLVTTARLELATPSLGN